MSTGGCGGGATGVIGGWLLGLFLPGSCYSASIVPILQSTCRPPPLLSQSLGLCCPLQRQKHRNSLNLDSIALSYPPTCYSATITSEILVSREFYFIFTPRYRAISISLSLLRKEFYFLLFTSQKK